jgi:ATP-dependent Clp protease ATP-binding subunit ClpA
MAKRSLSIAPNFFSTPSPTTTVRGKGSSENVLNTLVGQGDILDTVVSYVKSYKVGLIRQNAPQGVFALLGPTGVGKTLTVELVAEYLHGLRNRMICINCGEFAFDHEIAKLIGSPPGYLGHRETPARLNQQKLNSMVSENSRLTVILFDEIEKAAPTLQDLLLGILDKGNMQLGDGNSVNFENTLIFFTSNLGSREALAENLGKWNLSKSDKQTTTDSINLKAFTKHFSPEFVNRVDEVFVYSNLTKVNISEILDLELVNQQKFIDNAWGPKSPKIFLTDKFREFILPDEKQAKLYGARYVKRNLQKHVFHNLAEYVNQNGQFTNDAEIEIDYKNNKVCIERIN